MKHPPSVTIITSGPQIEGVVMGQVAKINGKRVRLYPSSDTQAHVYPEWPGRNRRERRRAASEARRAIKNG